MDTYAFQGMDNPGSDAYGSMVRVPGPWRIVMKGTCSGARSAGAVRGARKNTGKESKERFFTRVHSQHASSEFFPYTGLETVTKMHTGTRCECQALGSIVATYTR